MTQGSWTNFISVAAIVIAALSPVLRRVYIECFWIRGRGTVIRLEGGINTNPGAGGAWVWTPVIEYHAGRATIQFAVFILATSQRQTEIRDR